MTRPSSWVLLSVLWRYAVSADLVRPDAADEEVHTLTTRLTPGLGGYVLIVVGLFLPTIAIVGQLPIAVVLIVPFGLREGVGVTAMRCRPGLRMRHHRRLA